MKDVNIICENIQNGVLKLKERIKFLEQENNMLRRQLGMPVQKNNDELSIIEMLKQFDIKDDSKGMKTRVYNVLVRWGRFKVVGDLRGKNIYELLKLRNSGSSICAVIVVVLEYYGIHIEIPEVAGNSIHNKVRKVRENIVKYREKIIFIDNNF